MKVTFSAAVRGNRTLAEFFGRGFFMESTMEDARIRQYAVRVANEMVANGVPKEVGLSILTITAIISIIYYAIKLLMGYCKKTPAEAIDIARHPGMIGRAQRRRIIRKVLEPKGLGKYCPHTELAMDKVGQEIGQEDMVVLYQQVKFQEEAKSEEDSTGNDLPVDDKSDG